MCSAIQLRNAGIRTLRQDSPPRAYWSAYLLLLGFSQPTRSVPVRWRFPLSSHLHHPISIWRPATTVTRRWALRSVMERCPTANRVCRVVKLICLFTLLALFFLWRKTPFQWCQIKLFWRMLISLLFGVWLPSTHTLKCLWNKFVLSLCETLTPWKYVFFSCPIPRLFVLVLSLKIKNYFKHSVAKKSWLLNGW